MPRHAQRLPCFASAIKVRDTAYVFSLPDDKAEVMTTALMIDGRTDTEACWHMTTKGELAAVLPPNATASLSKGEYWLTVRPITSVDKK